MAGGKITHARSVLNGISTNRTAGAPNQRLPSVRGGIRWFPHAQCQMQRGDSSQKRKRDSSGVVKVRGVRNLGRGRLPTNDIFLPRAVFGRLGLIRRRIRHDSIAFLEPRDAWTDLFDRAGHAVAKDEGVRHVDVCTAADVGVERLDRYGLILLSF